MGCSKENRDSEIKLDQEIHLGFDLDQTLSMCCSKLFSRIG